MAKFKIKFRAPFLKRARKPAGEAHAERIDRAFRAFAARPNKQSDLPFVNRHQERAYGKRLRSEATKLRLEYQENLK
jgi:hypothetical protein